MQFLILLMTKRVFYVILLVVSEWSSLSAATGGGTDRSRTESGCRMRSLRKKLTMLLVCALLLCAGGSFALSGARSQPAGTRSAAPAPRQTAYEQEEGVTLPAEPTAAAVSTEPTASAAETTGAGETSTVPEDAVTTAKETSAGKKADPSVLSLTTTVPEKENGDPDAVVIGRFSLKESKIMPVRANAVVTDYLAAMGDAHAYTFSVEERGVMQIGFNYGVAEFSGVPWVVYLYEAYSANGTDVNDGWRLLTNLNISSSEVDVVKTEKIGLYPGDYAVVVSTGDVYSAADYTLMAAFITNTPWEAEPNDSRTRYNELSPGVKTGGSSANTPAADRDWFLVSLPAPGYISILFEHEKLGGAGVGWFLTLTNERGETILRQRSYLQDAETRSGEIGLDAGTYYLCVEATVRQDADYYITCGYEATDAYEKELNDTPENAGALTISGRSNRVSGSLSEKDGVPDADYYRMELANDGVISFTFLHKDLLRPRDGWRIVLTAEDGEEIFRMNSRWNEPDVSSPQIGLSAGTYYFRVDGEDMLFSQETYTISVTHAAGRNWETENNDTPASADPLTPGVIRYGTLVNAGLEYDTDYYSFTLEKTSAVTITFSHNTAIGTGEGWVIALTDESGRVLSSFSSKWETRSVNSALINLAPGKYYIRVDTGDIFSDVKYGVTLNIK